MNKQKLALFVLLILFLVALAWSFYATPRQKTVSTLKYVAGQKAIETRKPVIAVKQSSNSKKESVDVERVLRLDLLTTDKTYFKGYKRNIFKPVFLDELAQMKQKKSAFKIAALNSKESAMPKFSSQLPQIAQPEAPRSVLARFTFLGFVQKDGKKTIFLSKDKEIILVKNGERFSGGRYEIRSLTEQALTILVVENGEEIVVSLAENRPLIAVK